MKAVDVFGRIDGGNDTRRIDLRRQWQLHQDAVHSRIGVEFADKTNELVGAGRGRQMKIERLHADFDDGTRLAADIGFARRIFADQDHRQAGNEATRSRKPPRLRRHGVAQLRSDYLAVDDAGSHDATFARRCSFSTIPPAAPAIRIRFPRAVEPAISVTCRGAVSSTSANSRHSAVLAWPSNGAARTRALSTT